jgi:predicted nucleic acid-binding protein
MPAYFLDSSALLKRYIDEAGSEWVRDTIRQSTQPCFIAQVAGVEIVSAITRLHAGKAITPRARDAAITAFKSDFAGSYDVAMLSMDVTENAMRLAERRVLRGYDAIQLAAALFVAERAQRRSLELLFVCADTSLNRAAAAEGLKVENPNDHA